MAITLETFLHNTVVYSPMRRLLCDINGFGIVMRICVDILRESSSTPLLTGKLTLIVISNAFFWRSFF